MDSKSFSQPQAALATGLVAGSRVNCRQPFPNPVMEGLPRSSDKWATITYYFDTGEPETALAGALPYLLELSERASRATQSGLRLAGTVLGGAAHSFLEMLAEDFLSMPQDDKLAIMRTYATEHMSDLILADRTISYKKEEQEREAA